MEGDISVSAIVSTGALARIADYSSESEDEAARNVDETMNVDNVVATTAANEVHELSVVDQTMQPRQPDFEIEIQEDGDESTSKIECTSVSIVDKGEHDVTPISNPFALREQIEIEDYCSDEELPALCLSDEDSDVEFNRILDYTAKQRKKEHEREMGLIPAKRGKNELIKDLEREYDKLPPIENLTISVQENIKLKKLGRVRHIVDCLVIIEADSGLAIDYDSVIFREDRIALGKVFDIFGAVRCPSYSIRFNSEKEARLAASEGISVFVAEADQFTKRILTEKLNKEKHIDGALVLNEKGEEEELFSDDEAEQAARRAAGGGGRGRGRGNKRPRGGRGGGHFNHINMSWPPSQRGRGRANHNPYSSPYANGGGGPPMIDTRYMGGV